MKRLISALLFSGLFLSAAASANVIVNGGFDTGDFTGWTTFNSPNGTSSPAVTSTDVTGLGASLAAEFKAGEVVFFTGAYEGGGIGQLFSVASGMFRISADISVIGGDFTNETGGRFELFLDGMLLDAVTFDRTLAGEVVRDTLDYSGMIVGGMHELTIFTSRPYLASLATPHQYIDNVVVDLVNDVPEPGSTALFAVGVAAAMWAGRRTRRSSRAGKQSDFR